MNLKNKKTRIKTKIKIKTKINKISDFKIGGKMKKINKLLEIPDEVCSNIPKIVIKGFEEMMIENFKGIIEYEENLVKINTYIGIININGYNLHLENMTQDDLRITGKIESFDFERIIEEN